MVFVIGLLTVIMVLDCLILILLVLIQLPKKEAGAGLAFGGSATDALFGAGSGTVLTKITKYAAGGFFVLAIVLSLLQRSYHNRAGSAFARSISSAAPPPVMPGVPTSTAQSNTATPSAVTNIVPLAQPARTSAPAVTVPPPGTTNPTATPPK